MRLAIPISLQNLLMSSMHLVDSAMIMGMGDNAAAAVGMAGRWFFMFNIMLFGIASGASILMAQYWGVRDVRNIKRAYGLGLANAGIVVLLAMGAMLAWPMGMMRVFAGNDPAIVQLGADYMRIASFGCLAAAINTMVTSVLRNTENVRLPLYTSIFSICANTVLNYVLIYGKFGFPMLGVQGAATATIVSQFLQMALLLIACYATKNLAAAKPKELFNWDRLFVAKFYKVAVWVLINEAIWSIGSNLYSVVLGRQGASNYAAYTLFSSIDGMIFSLFMGFGNACVVMVGKAVGRGDNEEAWLNGKRFYWLAVVIAAVLGLVLIAIRVPLINLMNPPNPETALMAQRLLLLSGVMAVFRLIPYVLVVGIFRSGGSPKLSALVDLLPMFLVGLPLAFLGGFVWKLPFIWVFSAVYVEEIAKVIMGTIIFLKKGWMHRLTSDDAEEKGYAGD